MVSESIEPGDAGKARLGGMKAQPGNPGSETSDLTAADVTAVRKSTTHDGEAS